MRNIFIMGIVFIFICPTSFAQNVGIGTNSPKARLHVADSSVVFTGLNDNILYPAIPPPVQGPGIRMLWYPEKAAFRAGFAGFNTWDRDNIGTHSFAGGQGTLAKGRSTVAFGLGTEAIGDFSAATGIYTRTRSYGSIVVGAYNNSSDNPNPLAMMPEDRIFQIGNGISSNARSNALTVLRNGNAGIGEVNPLLAGLVVNKKVGATNAIFGANTTGLAIESSFPGIGFNSYYDGSRKAIANGYAGYIGVNPVDGGMQFWVSPFSEEAGNDVFIKAAVAIAPNGNVGIGLSDPDFILDVNGRIRLRAPFGYSSGIWLNNEENTGISAFMGMRSDTEIGFYGNGWIFSVNTTTGDGFLKGSIATNSDARLKKDMVPISNSLEAIQQINGYSYHWKDASNPDEQIGLLAQEIQKVYPQLVKENEQGILSVNYSGMVPVLLTAIKEQQAQIDELKKMLMQLQKNK